ncbi:hypothetical protein QNM99_27260 [Pseudomonas sp. PCH446]
MMAGLGLSVNDVASRLRAMQKDNSGGQGDLGSGQQALRILGAIDDPAALGPSAFPSVTDACSPCSSWPRYAIAMPSAAPGLIATASR